MSKIRAVIIEDEIPAARLLNKMVSELRPEWEITVLPGMIEDAVNGLQSIRIQTSFSSTYSLTTAYHSCS